jgi:transposase InsO family protein
MLRSIIVDKDLEIAIMINKKKVYRLCNEMNLLFPIERHHRSKECPIAFKKVAVNAPNSHWQMDITYVTLFPRIIFVLGIIDTYTLEIVGYKVGFSITGRDVVKTVLKSMVARNIQGDFTIRTDNGTAHRLNPRNFRSFANARAYYTSAYPRDHRREIRT